MKYTFVLAAAIAIGCFRSTQSTASCQAYTTEVQNGVHMDNLDILDSNLAAVAKIPAVGIKNYQLKLKMTVNNIAHGPTKYDMLIELYVSGKTKVLFFTATVADLKVECPVQDKCVFDVMPCKSFSSKLNVNPEICMTIVADPSENTLKKGVFGAYFINIALPDFAGDLPSGLIEASLQIQVSLKKADTKAPVGCFYKNFDIQP